MASPLLEFANARVLLKVEGSISLVDGRFVAASGASKLVGCYMKRAQYTGVSSGSRKIPLDSQLDGRMMPGGQGDQFYYRGYALEYADVASDFELGDSEAGLTWFPMVSQPSWMQPGTVVRFMFGDETFMDAATIERSSGVFGGAGIDEIIYKEIGGLPLQITAGELLR